MKTAPWWTFCAGSELRSPTLGSEKWPESGAGRTLCFGLALYAAAVFGYLTAALASYFIDRDADAAESVVAGEQELRALRAEVAALRAQIRALAPALPHQDGVAPPPDSPA